MMPTKSPTIQQLRCFVAVALTQQFTVAAASLNMAQPSLSQQIRHLEEVLGAALFQRSYRPVRLTDAGLELLPLARRVVNDLDDIFERVSDVTALRRGHVTVGATPSLGATLMPEALARFRRRYPGITVTFVERHSNELLDELESAALDLALVILPIPRPTLDSVVVATETLVVVVATDHPLAGRDLVSIRDLDGVPMIMFREGYDVKNATMDAFARADVTLNVALDGAEMGSVLSFVAAGMGAAIVPSIVAYANPDVKVLLVGPPTLQRTISLVRPLRHVSSQAATALSTEITDYLRERRWPTITSPDD
ncbi:MAG TPA: LysR substrate-binding domain-containing protein [Acidimicrobiales bacterium]|jgi:DNA-binding transcriptional LysR family regulator|nr:LysR substrate-binding domain-containing protein [Acidimicrobiales bacterium]